MQYSYTQLQAKMLRSYYQYFSKYAKGKVPEKKVAWVTAFTPVEILEALDIAYYYPESYAAVIAASGKEQELLKESDKVGLCLDCCSYSCCIEGSLELCQGPRGTLPRPDVLIATNNQCNTLPNWWNILAIRYHVPLIVLDYPGESVPADEAEEYVTAQHRHLITEMEKISGNRMDWEKLSYIVDISKKSIEAWENVVSLFMIHDISPTILFDSISYLITLKCKEETIEIYRLLADELTETPPYDSSKKPIFWLGYPLWYHNKRYLNELFEEYRIAGSNYITWWSLDYSGENVLKKLFSAYNFTFLNLSMESKTKRLKKLIEKSGAIGAVVLHNKSCKCDFVSAREIGIPQFEIEIDMIDRNYADVGRCKQQLEIFEESL